MNIRSVLIKCRTALLLLSLAILLSIASWQPTSAQELPRIFVTPDVVVGGQTVTIRGLDFTPGSNNGLIFWDGVWTDTAPIEKGGDFSAQFRIPPSATAGKHTIRVCSADALNNCLAGRDERIAEASVEVTAPAPIRICKETFDPCEPYAGAIVYDITNGKNFDVDKAGLVLEREAIAEGDLIWVAAVNSTAKSYRVLATSGEPIAVIDKVFTGDPVELRIAVGLADPLVLFDLDLSAEWYVEGNPQYASWLENALIDAAHYLYEFTEGQMTLGKVTVAQNMESWDQVDVRLLANNVLRPNAEIGGIVGAEVADPLSGIQYQPGQVYMGSHWNRYALPPNQSVMVGGKPVSPESLVNDWAMAFAHELGHYLLFLFDTYRDSEGNDSAEIAALCSGSAMGDVYQPSNHSFIADPAEWKAKCNVTEAYVKHRGNSEWETIAGWYPWITPPNGPSSQPDIPLVEMTEVIFLPTSVPTSDPATSQIFDLNYQDGESSSGEARVFTYRNDRVVEQGKPAAGINQASLIGAQVDDRLCVYDVNDYAQSGDSPRHQFGCEAIQPGDAALDMTKDLSWAPLILLTQVATDTVTISVTQEAGAVGFDTLMVRLYPEHEIGHEPIALIAGENDTYHVQLTLTETVPPAYLQIWAEDVISGTVSRRETMVDRGTGGGGLFGPARRFGGAFIYSSDGKASFRTEGDLLLLGGESIAWQSMPGTPSLPIDLRITGQAYRLTAFPPSLVISGTVEIEFEEVAESFIVSASEAMAQAANEPVVHFFDGDTWIPLSTTVEAPTSARDGIKIAAAPSKGVGIYAVLTERDVEKIWIPFVTSR